MSTTYAYSNKFQFSWGRTFFSRLIYQGLSDYLLLIRILSVVVSYHIELKIYIFLFANCDDSLMFRISPSISGRILEA